ncbi:MAG TPA: AI-2E family transporter [Bauldia sp.]|nr:AI-2E family transporter [Bauldia sp.]
MTHIPPPEHEIEPPVRYALPPAVNFSIVGTFIIALCAALYYARSFFLPLVLAILITMTFAPAVRALAHRGIPYAVSAVMLVVVLGGAIATTSTLLTGPVSQMIAETPVLVEKIRDRFDFLREPFRKLNEASRQVQALTSGNTDQPGEPERVVVQQESGLLGWAAGTAADFGTTFFATMILALFLLASGTTLRSKLIRVLPDLSGKKRSLRVLRDIENEVSRYLLTIAAINAGLGLCIGLVMAILGLPNPLLWGIAGGLLNFIPYLGSLVGNLLATAVAIVTFPSLAEAALVPVSYLALQIIEGNFVTPFIVGRRLELNIVAILIFLSLTTWMWGIVGAIIGVPLLVVVKVFADNFPAIAPLAEFLSGETRTAEEADMEHAATPPGS